MTTSKGYIFDIKRFCDTRWKRNSYNCIFLRGVHFVVNGVKIQKDCLIYHKFYIWNQVYALS